MKTYVLEIHNRKPIERKTTSFRSVSPGSQYWPQKLSRERECGVGFDGFSPNKAFSLVETDTGGLSAKCLK